MADNALLTTTSERRKSFLRRVVSDGVRLGVESAYSTPDKMTTYRNLAHHEFRGAWFSDIKMWVFPLARGEKFIRLLPDKMPGTVLPEETEKILGEALANPDPYYFLPSLNVRVFPTNSGKIAVHSSFEWSLVRAFKAIGGEWLEKSRFWTFEMPAELFVSRLEKAAGVNPENVSLYHGTVSIDQISGSGSGGAFLAGLVGGTGVLAPPSPPRKKGERQLNISPLVEPLKKMPVDPDLLEKLRVAYGLLDHQVPAVRHLLSSTSSLLADDTGLGKTRSAIVAAIASGGRTLVVCPATLKTNWKREILMTKENESAIFVLGPGQKSVPPGAKWVIVNYESLEHLVFKKHEFKNIIVDEAHYIKEFSADRNKNAFLVAANIPRKMLITATPILNREAEIYTLLRFSGHPIGMMEKKDFLAEFGKSSESRAALRERISEWMIRRTREEAIKLPEAQTIFPVIDPSPELLGKYNKTLADPTLISIQRTVHLRHLVETMHAEWIGEEILDVVQHHKSIIFCEHIDVVESLMDRFEERQIGAVKLTGEEADSKYRAIDALQKDEDVRVMVATIKVASEGITLTKATYAWFAVIPYTPGQLHQAMARIYRIGQDRPVTFVIPQIPGTIDDGVLAMQKNKKQIITEIGF